MIFFKYSNYAHAVPASFIGWRLDRCLSHDSELHWWLLGSRPDSGMSRGCFKVWDFLPSLWVFTQGSSSLKQTTQKQNFLCFTLQAFNLHSYSEREQTYYKNALILLWQNILMNLEWSCAVEIYRRRRGRGFFVSGYDSLKGCRNVKIFPFFLPCGEILKQRRAAALKAPILPGQMSH